MTYAAEVLADSPLAWWRLQEASGATFADSSGNSRDLSVSGTPAYRGASPGMISGFSAAFSGSEYASIAAPTWFTAGSAWSLECWVKTSTSSLNAGVITRDDTHLSAPDATRMIQLEVSSGKGALEIFNSAGSNFVLDSATLTDGAWHHLLMTYGSNTGTLYKDAVSIGTCPLTGPLTAGTGVALLLGATMNNGTPFRNFIGSLAEPAVYGAALSGARVSAHYNAAFVPQAPLVRPLPRTFDTVLARATR